MQICSCGGLPSRYNCYTCLKPAVMSLCSYPSNGHVKHNCTRPSGMYVTVAPDQQPYLYKCAYYQHACLLQFRFISSQVYYLCTRPSAMSVTIASHHLPCLSQIHTPSQQSCQTLLNLHLQACMSDTLALDQHSYLL